MMRGGDACVALVPIACMLVTSMLFSSMRGGDACVALVPIACMLVTSMLFSSMRGGDACATLVSTLASPSSLQHNLALQSLHVGVNATPFGRQHLAYTKHHSVRHPFQPHLTRH